VTVSEECVIGVEGCGRRCIVFLARKSGVSSQVAFGTSTLAFCSSL
jgi:hypothetical protein